MSRTDMDWRHPRNYGKFFPLTWILWVVMILSCSSKVKQEVSSRFEVLLGDKQLAMPGELLKQPIEFRLLDNAGVAIPGAPVNLKLLSLEAITGEPTLDAVKNLWDASLNLKQDVFTEVETVGRIDGAKETLTDPSGRVRVTVIAPTRFSARVAVAARIKSGVGLPDALGFAFVSTSRADEMGVLSLESNYENNIVPAGKNVDFWITLRDTRGRIVTTFEGESLFSFGGSKPTTSWLGLAGTNFKPEISCRFLAGRCLLGGGPYNFANAEDLKISIQGLKPYSPEFQTTISVRKGDKPTRTVLADNPGGSESGARALTSVTLLAGARASLAAAWIDDGGNWLGDATDTRWQASDETFQNLLPADARSTFTFKPLQRALFQLTLTSPSSPSGSVVPIEVRAGALAAWRLSTQGKGVEVAGKCFTLNVEAIDSLGNVIPTIEGTFDAQIDLGGVLQSAPAVDDIAHFKNLGNRLTSSIATKVTFQFGVGTPSETACLFDATNVSPTVAFLAQGLRASVPVKVLKGQPAQIKLSKEDTGENAANACDFSVVLPGERCGKLVFNADDVAASSKTPVSLYATIADSAGNWLSNTTASWQANGVLTQSNAKLPGVKLVNSGIQIHKQDLYPVVAGLGSFSLTVPNNLLAAQIFQYEVLHGNPSNATVESQNRGNEVAGKDFNVKVVLFDQWNNPTITHSGSYAAKVRATRSPAAPNGTATVGSFDWPMQFTTNNTLVSSGSLNLKCSCNPEVQPAAGLGCRDATLGYFSSDSGKTFECPKIQVEIPGVGLFESSQTRVNNSSLASMKVRTESGGAGTELKDSIVAPATQVIQEIFRPLNMYLAGYDDLGNYIGEINSNLSWNWDFDPTATTSKPVPFKNSTDSAPVLVSTQTGVGKLTAVAAVNAKISVDSPSVAFKSTSAGRYELSTDNKDAVLKQPLETAGIPFHIYISATDVLGNVDVNFNGTRSFKLRAASTRSWNNQSPVLPDSDVIYPCTFESGVCSVVAPENSGGWLVTDASLPVVLSVVEVTEDTALPSGGSRIAGTFSTTINVIKSPAFRLVLASRAGGPAQGAIVKEYSQANLLMTTDETETFAVAQVDKGGNYVADEPDPLLEGDATYVLPFVTKSPATATGPSVTFAPKKAVPRDAASGEPNAVVLTMKSRTTNVTSVSLSSLIFHGNPARVDVSYIEESAPGVWNGPTVVQLKAGNCYNIKFTLVDANANIIDSADSPALQLLVGLRGNDITNPPPGFVRRPLNFNGGIYSALNRVTRREDPQQMFRFSFIAGDPLLRSGYSSGPDPRIYSPGAPSNYSDAGLLLAATDVTRPGQLKPPMPLYYCPAIVTPGVAGTGYAPTIDAEVVGGLNYKNKKNQIVPMTFSSQTHVVGSSQPVTVTAGTAALVALREVRNTSTGSTVTLDPVCRWFSQLQYLSPNSQSYIPYNGSISTTNNMRFIYDSAIDDPDTKPCRILDPDFGGVYLFAERTDLAGNYVAPVSASSSWTSITASDGGGSSSHPISITDQWIKTSDTLRDNFTVSSDPAVRKRPSGLYEVVFRDPDLGSNGFTATLSVALSAGRPTSFSLSQIGLTNGKSTYAAADTGGRFEIGASDHWGNGNTCFANTLTYDLNWADPNKVPAWPPKVSINSLTRPLAPSVLQSGFKACNLAPMARPGDTQAGMSSVAFHIPTAGQWPVRVTVSKLIDPTRMLANGQFAIASPVSQTITLQVNPGKLSTVKAGYTNSSGGFVYTPVNDGMDFVPWTGQGNPTSSPYVLKSYDNLAAVNSDKIGVYLKGYDVEGNYWGISVSSLTVVGSSLSTQMGGEFTPLNCQTLQKILCKDASQQGRSGGYLFYGAGNDFNFGANGELVHSISGTKAGVISLKLQSLDLAGSPGEVVLPAITVVPNVPRIMAPQFQPTTDRKKNGSGKALIDTKLDFNILVVDQNFNPVTWNEPHNLDFLFTNSIGFSNREKVSNLAPSSGLYNFTNGLSDQIFSVSFLRSGTYKFQARSDSTASLYLTANADGADAEVLPGPFDHYGTFTNFLEGTLPNYVPDRNGNSKFTGYIELRDKNGNALDASAGPGRPIRVTIVRENGTVPAGAADLGGVTTEIMPTGLLTTIPNMSYRESGKFRLIATDSANVSTPLPKAADVIVMDPSLALISKYKIIPKDIVTSVWTPIAGDSELVEVDAVDNYNQPISGLDAILNAQDFTWTGPSNALDSLATPPILPSKLTFGNGIATATIKFFKAETISAGNFKIRDNQATPLVGQYEFPVSVLAGPIYEYTIASSQTTRKAENSVDGYFDLTIKTYDQWKNPVMGDPNVTLRAKRISGTGQTADFFTTADSNPKSSIYTRNFSMAVSDNGTPGVKIFTNLYYPVGHTVEIGLSGISATATVTQKPTMALTYSAGSVSGYTLDFSSTSFTAGDPITYTVTAVDRVGNTIPTLDSYLNNLNFTITGPNASPNGNVPAFLSQSKWTFTDGIASQQIVFFKAETISTFAMVDSGTPSLRGQNQSPIVVSEGTVQPSGVLLPSSGTIATQTAGVAFSLVGKTVDAFGNPSDLGCPGGMQLLGGSESPGGYGGTKTLSNVPLGTKTGKGSYSFPNILLTKSGTESLTLNACGFIAVTKDVTVNPASVNRMVLSTSGTVPTSTDLGITGANSTGEITCTNTSPTSSATDCGTVYSYFWDAYGNRVDPVASSCTWTWTNATATHGLTITAPWNLNGFGSSRAVASSDFIDGTLSCQRDTITKTITFWGGVAKVDATATFTLGGNTTLPPFTAGTQVTFSGIKAWASKDGSLAILPDAEKNSAKSISFSNTLVVSILPSTVNCTLSDSVCPTTYTGFLRTAGSQGSLSVNMQGKKVKWDNITVSPAAASRIDVEQLPTVNPIAGISVPNVKFSVRDQFGNGTTTSSNGTDQCTAVNVSFAGTDTSPGGRGRTQAAPTAILTPTTPQNIGEYIYTLTMYKAGLNTISVTGCGIPNTAPTLITVAPNVAKVGYLSINSVDTSVTTATSSFDCVHSTNPSSAALTCSTFYSYFWDDWGNSLNATNPVSCTWTYENATPTGVLTAATVPTQFAGGTSINASSIALTATDFIDGKVKCSKDNIIAESFIYGGISRFTATSSPASLASLTASNSANVTFNVGGIQLFQRRQGVDQSSFLSVSKDFVVGIDTGSSTNGFSDLFPNCTLPSCDSTNKTVTRTFSAAAATSTSSISLIYKKASLSNSLTLKIYGKTQSYSGITVNPAPASKIVINSINGNTATTTFNSLTAGTAFNFEAEVRDASDNRTTISSATGNPSCASEKLFVDYDSGQKSSPGLPGTSQTFSSLQVDPLAGVYPVNNVTLYRAGSTSSSDFRLSLSACNVTQRFNTTVNPATVSWENVTTTSTRPTTALASAATGPSEVICDNSGTSNSVKCVVYAWFWDTYGNPRSSDTCSWTYTSDPSTSATLTPTRDSVTNRTDLSDTTKKFVDGLLKCKTGSPDIRLYGGVKSIQITASANSADITAASSTDLIAGQNNFSITRIALRTTKAGADIDSPITSSTVPLTWNTSVSQSWTSNATDYFGQPSSSNLSFSSGVNSTPYLFNMRKADISTKTFSASVYGVTSNTVNIKIVPGSASSLSITVPASTVAGSAISVGIQAKDSSGNLTSDGCSTATISGEGDLNPPGDTVTFPSPLSLTGTGQFANGSVTLKKKDSNQLKVQACGISQTSSVITVSPAALNRILLAGVSNSTAPAQPGYGVSVNSLSCTEGSTVTCPYIFAYGEDLYGNPMGQMTTCIWTHDVNNSPSTTTTNGGYLITNQNFHVSGTATCTASSKSASVALFGKIQKQLSPSCTAWACNAGTPESRCTLTNSHSYPIDSVSISPSPSSNSCTGALSNSSSCQAIFNGTAGSSSGNATFGGSSNSGNVTFISGSSGIGAAVNAPNCSNALTATATAWSCGASQGLDTITVTFKNTSTVNDFNPSGSAGATLVTANGATITSNWPNAIVKNNGTGTVTIRGTARGGGTSTIHLNSTDANFPNAAFTTPPNNCP